MEAIMDKGRKICEEIERVAYEIYEKRGIPGCEVENWLEAEKIVLERYVTPEAPQSANNPKPRGKRVARKK